MKILAWVYSNDYCCLAGYLGLCQARGETVKGMAEASGMSEDTIWYHLRKQRAGCVPCEGKSDCLTPIIEDMKKGP